MDFDWYVEPKFVPEQIFDAISFGPKDNPDLIWDCCAGSGTCLDVAKERGHPTVASDIIDRKPRHKFFRTNVLNAKKAPQMPGRTTSILTNPPFSYEPDICERIIRHTLQFNIRRAVFIVPIAFVCGQGRYSLYAEDFTPSHLLIFSQRPTMPPGKLIHEMTSPFTGGMADYCAIAFTYPHRWKTQTVWLKP